MSKVYLVHVPTYWDRDQKTMVPFDISGLNKYGEQVVVFPGLKRPPANEKAIGAIHRTLAKFTPDDYLVVAGDMDLVIWASYLALSRTNGRLKLLKWNNRLRNYDLICAPDGLTELTKEAA